WANPDGRLMANPPGHARKNGPDGPRTGPRRPCPEKRIQALSTPSSPTPFVGRGSQITIPHDPRFTTHDPFFHIIVVPCRFVATIGPDPGIATVVQNGS